MKALICGGLVGLVSGVIAVMLPSGLSELVTGAGTLLALAVVNGVQRTVDDERRKKYVSQFDRR